MITFIFGSQIHHPKHILYVHSVTSGTLNNIPFAGSCLTWIGKGQSIFDGSGRLQMVFQSGLPIAPFTNMD